MELIWLGHSCFRLRGKDLAGKDVVAITDPYDKSVGYALGRPTAQIVTISHHHPDHDNVAGVSGKPIVIDGPGEYEVAGVYIHGLGTYHDAENGKRQGKNTVYLMEINEVNVCHLGDLGHVLTPGQIEELGHVDVLLVPVGGGGSLSAAGAAETISLLEPKIVVPMHYRTDVVKQELDPLDKFAKEMGLKDITPQPKLTITKASLPQETRVMVLDYHR